MHWPGLWSGQCTDSHVTDALTSIVKWAVYWQPCDWCDALTSIVKWAVYWQPCDWSTDQYCEVGSVLTAMWLMHWPVLWGGQCTDSHVTDALIRIVKWTVYWQPCDWYTDQDCEVDSVLTAMWLMHWPGLWSGQCTDTAMWLMHWLGLWSGQCTDSHVTNVMHWLGLWSGQGTDSHVTDALTSIVKWTVYWQPCDWCDALTEKWTGYWQPCDWCTDQYCEVDSVLTAMWLMHWPGLWSGQCTDSHVTDALTRIVKWTVYWHSHVTDALTGLWSGQCTANF